MVTRQWNKTPVWHLLIARYPYSTLWSAPMLVHLGKADVKLSMWDAGCVPRTLSQGLRGQPAAAPVLVVINNV